MKIYKLLMICLIAINPSIYSQNFIKSDGTSFTGTTDGTVHLVDVDSDGDLDCFITGDQGGSGFQGVAELYTNDGTGSFTLVSGTPFSGVESASSEFADLDNDGDLDLILTGSISGGRIAHMYTNDGAGKFSLVAGTPFKDVSVGDVVIADLDGDSDLDVIISGYNTTAAARISEVYKNDGSASFTLFTASPTFDLANEGDVDVADVDGDNDLDILITGDTGPSELTSLYLNDGTGIFTKDVTQSTLFTDMRDSDADFADVDGDGDQDLLINGRYSTSTRTAELYLNNGSGEFSLVAGTPFTGGNAGTVDFFDYDNDGDMDVLLSGYEEVAPNRNTRLYSNDGLGNFSEVTSETFTGINNADVAIGDINGDSKKDIIILGYSSTRIAEIYLNSTATSNASHILLNEEVQVYPNPTNDIINIDLFGEIPESIDIINSTGQVLFSTNSYKGIDISDLSDGIYFVKINFNGTSYAKKIIKK
ncbi:T9SS type A sorting domain-containing protein [Labilibacter sediminis]|nr:T9SS type A sorting domain-containing protein [Labilibacter sediminis]